ncbi:MAG: S8 family serine peptidase [Prevotellaceae bacterium]|nr:S8 family serine peptidase [Prevotellaceae bacterium]
MKKVIFIVSLCLLYIIGNALPPLKTQEAAKTVTVALIGYGMDVKQEDLAGAIWTNPKEEPNGKDDDHNGYIDDLHGWNFLGTPDGKSLNRLSRVGDREFFRLKDKYAHCVFVNNKCYTLDTLTQQVVETALPANRAEFDYFRNEVLPEAPIGGSYMGVLFAKMVVAFVHDADRTLRQKYPGKALTKRDFETVYDGHSPDTLINFFAGSVQLLFMSAGSENWDAMLQFADTGYVRHQERGYERQLRSTFLGERKYIGDNPYDINDKSYGNNNLASANAGQGVMLAGIIAGRYNNYTGRDSMAGNVKIMTLRINADFYGEPYMKDMANAIRYAVDHGAGIIQLGKTNAIYPQPWSKWVDEALRYAEEKGVLVVIPMMDLSYNLDDKPFYPGKYVDGGVLSNVITVAASDAGGNPYSTVNFSNKELDLFAPGVGEYALNSGSEFAASVLTGVAALIKGHYPEITPAAMRKLLMETVTPRDEAEVEKSFVMYHNGVKGRRVRDVFMFKDLCVSGGILNAEKALAEAGKRYGGHAVREQIQRKTDTIPFEILQGKFIIEATINGKLARLIMDTGGITTLTSDTVNHYGATVSNIGTFADVNKARLNFGTGTVEHLHIGDLLVWKSANVTVVPGNGFFRTLGVAGTVGGDIFQPVCLTIDKRNKQFIITYPYRPKGISRSDGTPMELGEYIQPKVPMTIGGKSINVLFDTGMPDFLALGQQDYAGLKSSTEVQQTGYGFMHVGIGGIKSARPDTLYKVNVPVMTAPGGKAFRNVNTMITPNEQTLVGQVLLDYGRVMLDYPRGLFYFFPYDDEPVDMTALNRLWNVRILPIDGHFEVTAAIGDCDFRTGERVWNINGTDLTAAEQSELVIDRIFASISKDTAWMLVGNDRKKSRKVTIRKI